MVKTIEYIYNTKTYLDKYGGSMFITSTTFFIIFLIISYNIFLLNIDDIKLNWNKKKCSPSVMPFVGFTLPSGSSFSEKMDFTVQNCVSCLQSIIVKFGDVMFQPILSLFSLLNESIKIMNEGLSHIKDFIDKMITLVAAILTKIIEMFLYITIPIRKFLIYLKSTVHKMGAIIQTTLNIVSTMVYSMVASIYAILWQMLITALIATAAIAVVAFIVAVATVLVPVLNGFTAAAAISAFVAWSSMVLLFSAFAIAITTVIPPNFAKTGGGRGVPSKPKQSVPKFCFDEDTIIRLKNGERKKIKHVVVGNVLSDSSVVQCTFKCATNNQEMYLLNNVIVSEKHKVYYNESLVNVKDHPKSKLIEDYCKDTLYCLGTSNKKININNTIFTDWDELDEMDMIELKNTCGDYLPDRCTTTDFHNYLNGGFSGTTKIELMDGNSVNFKDIKVNDTLRFGERVLAGVTLDSRKMNNIGKHVIDGYEFIGGSNINYYDENLGIVSTLENNTIQDRSDNQELLYNIITDNGFFIINGVRFLDYNSCVELFFDDDRNKNYSHYC